MVDPRVPGPIVVEKAAEKMALLLSLKGIVSMTLTASKVLGTKLEGIAGDDTYAIEGFGCICWPTCCCLCCCWLPQ